VGGRVVVVGGLVVVVVGGLVVGTVWAGCGAGGAVAVAGAGAGTVVGGRVVVVVGGALVVVLAGGAVGGVDFAATPRSAPAAPAVVPALAPGCSRATTTPIRAATPVDTKTMARVRRRRRASACARSRGEYWSRMRLMANTGRRRLGKPLAPNKGLRRVLGTG
jgi:hypothetical protein